jgi:phytoene desaturase
MLLAASGCRVTVIERANQVGGRTSYIEESGFRFDRGPTFFLYPEVLRSIFAMCGRCLEDEVELTRLEPNYQLAFEDGPKIDASSDIDRLRSEIAKLCPTDAANLDRYIADNREKFAAFRPILESPFDSHLDLLRLPLRKVLPMARPWSSVDADLRRYFSDPRVRLALSFQSKYLGMSPFKCPSLFTILAFLEYEFGVYHPRGGCAAVSQAMHKVAVEMGVEFRLGEPVESLSFNGRKVTAAQTASERFECDALVINADFANAMRDLVPDELRTRWSNRRIAKSKMSCSTFMMYLGIEGSYDDLAHHTIFLSKDYERNLNDIERDFRVPENPSVYVHNPSRIDATLAPPGHSSLYVLAPVPHENRNIDWSVRTPEFRSRILKQLGRIGADDIEQRIVAERVFTPANWAGDMNLYKGATFSLAHSLDQMLSFRPHNRFEDLDSVYLVGGGTHPGSGLPVIYQSAKTTSRLLAQDFGLSITQRPHAAGSDPDWSSLATESA